MKKIKVGSVISQKSGNKFGVTRIIDDKRFLGIWVGNKNFTNMTTFNGFMRNGDFSLDNGLFKLTKNGFRKVKSPTGVLGLINGDSSIFDLVNN